MEQVITLKLRLYTDSQQDTLLHDTIKAYLKGCNMVSAYVFEHYDLSQSSLNKALYQGIRSMCGLRSQMAQSVIKTVIGSYKAMQSNGHEWHRAIYRHGIADMVWNRDYTVDAINHVLSVNTLEGRIKVSFEGAYFDRYLSVPGITFGTAKLVQKHGMSWLHVPASVQMPELAMQNVCNVVGIDRGTRFLATAYDSKGNTVFYSGKYAKHLKIKYAYTRKTLQEKGTPSSRRRLKAIGSRENRFMSDMNHCISKALVESNPKGTLFVLEDLKGIRGMTDKHCINGKHLLTSWSFDDLAFKLEYKAVQKGSAVLYRDPAYTSQACPKCGHTERSNRDKRKHVFQCRTCGYTSNDDRVAAMNLQEMGRLYLVPSAVGAD